MALLSTGTSTTSVDLQQYETFGSTIKLVRGDTLPQLTITLKDSNTAATGATLDANDPTTWAPINLTGATVLVKIKQVGSSAVKEELPAYTFGDPADGIVFMGWTSTALDTAGEFTGEIEITYSGGGVLTVYKQLSFVVREDY